MAIQKKHGKGRLDKWYKLAKEKGYRARASFKLIQLNKKFGFLERSKVALDLCAAPGSWCQVAAECMPTESLIVGVDLVPIKSIPRVITFQSDITTDKCRATIRQHLKTWKADTVLHDGAPNVGTAWVQDAFSQAELALQSMKLATEFLVPGGTFVTKVFRSKDYNPLLWVFKQLFTNVEATKPPSSRNVSAEIFVVCQGFKAPKYIDPKFLDPRHVFAELQDPTPNNEARVFNPEKKKRKREGYEEGNYTQFKEVSVTEFINTTDPIAILGTYNRLSFQQSPSGDIALATLERLPETTEEIRMCCDDLKVLGKKDFRILLRWRLKVREKFGLAVKKDSVAKRSEGEEVTEIAPMDEELAVQEELQRMHDQQNSRKRKERRKENERKQKEIVRMQMNMTTPMDIGMEQAGPIGDGAMFNIKPVNRDGAERTIARGKMASLIDEEEKESDHAASDNETDDEEDRLERELDSMYEKYQESREDRDTKLRAKRDRQKYEKDDEWEGFSNSGSEDENDEENADMAGDESTTAKTPQSKALSNKAALFFDQDIFHEIGDLGGEEEEEGDSDGDVGLDDSESQGSTGKEIEKPPKSSAPESKDAKKDKTDHEQDQDQDIAASDWGNDMYGDEHEKQEDPRKQNGRLDVDVITAEAMTLARSIATGEKTSQDVADDGFNKFAFRDEDGLPEWFLDDERRHSKPNRPITAASAAAIREKMRALNARPIKKVREAKSRKKLKQAQKLEKLRKKSSLLAEDEAMSERDKAQSISNMMSKAAKKKPKQKVNLVVAKGPNRGISGRPKGVKGKYKIVDSRMKKDIRAEKRAAKKRTGR